MIIHANVFIYLIALAAALILGLVLRLPLLPNKPIRHSWTISAVFPTAVLAVGFYAMVYELGYQGYIVALITGIITALFSKFILEKLVPVPQKDGEEESSHE
ncbi:MAG: energy-converting hydrogenase A subunit A EhaA [Methanobacterium sp.]|jgi:energy-converting hydrogenase A subunit A|uniref:energy-converting hydrogenase A subunit A EhaA n=1 Tax=Methanobacterium sp. TaxID=2164 RepID=UPI002588825F|nr:energy-converting hydrogenase A subunit A EhaA [Methanobacterium sp.]MCC7558914.1 energy-converting hydrogenase A subunit A EhaA [Methanobacterium sp.]